MIKILIDNGHGVNTPGKCSPDRELREYKWAREIATRIEAELHKRGVAAQRIVTVDNDVPLRERVAAVNNQCKVLGAKNVLLVSVHINAAGADGKWHTANGFSVFVSKNASAASKECAAIFTDKAVKRGLTGDRSVPASKYWTWSWTTADIYILKHSNCPAVLTENMFQDNLKDKQWLMSEQGKECIVNLHVDAIMEYIKRRG